MLKLIDGYKTYGVAVATVLFGIIGMYLKVFGAQQGIGYILSGLALIGGRSAVAKLINSLNQLYGLLSGVKDSESLNTP